MVIFTEIGDTVTVILFSVFGNEFLKSFGISRAGLKFPAKQLRRPKFCKRREHEEIFPFYDAVFLAVSERDRL